MSTTPQSPIDGPGGPGGVIEVLTRDAIGPQLVIARATGDSLPSFGIAGTARVALAKHLALRISASGTRRCARSRAARERLARRAAGAPRRGSTRLEYRDGDRRVVLDGFLDDRHYVSPPSDTDNSSILMIDRETSARASAKGDLKRDKLQLQGQALGAPPATAARATSSTRRSTTSSASRISTRCASAAWRSRRIRSARTRAGPRRRASITISADVANIAGEHRRAATSRCSSSRPTCQYEQQTLRVDGAAGAAVPFGVGADPWPEAKLVVKWRPAFGPLELTATGGRKGRVPSLRERFDLAVGNPALGPEHASHAELRASYDDQRSRKGRGSHRSTSARAAPCVRRRTRPTWAS